MDGSAKQTDPSSKRDIDRSSYLAEIGQTLAGFGTESFGFRLSLRRGCRRNTVGVVVMRRQFPSHWHWPGMVLVLLLVVVVLLALLLMLFILEPVHLYMECVVCQRSQIEYLRLVVVGAITSAMLNYKIALRYQVGPLCRP